MVITATLLLIKEKLIFLRCFENKKDALRFERKLKSLRNKEIIAKEFGGYFFKY
jgi:predicted GIY-YIG superfamily endonuclease